MNTFLNFLFASVKAGTPLLFGTTGEIVTEKAGNTNLGVEGMMFMGAFMGFFVACYSDSLILALLAAFALGVFGALIYAYITVSLRANQVVTGLALTIFGSGLANFFGQLMIANYKTGKRRCNSETFRKNDCNSGGKTHSAPFANSVCRKSFVFAQYFGLSRGNYRGFVQILYETYSSGT